MKIKKMTLELRGKSNYLYYMKEHLNKEHPATRKRLKIIHKEIGGD